MSYRSFIASLLIGSCIGVCHYVPYVLPVHAETAEELKGNLDSLSLKIKALDEEIKAYTTKISKTQGEAKTLKSALAKLEERRRALAKDIEYTSLRIRKTEENITFTRNKIENTEGKLEETKAALSQSLRSLVQNEPTLPYFVMSLAPGAQLSDALDVFKRSKEVTDAINEKTQALSDTKDVLEIQKNSYEKHKNTLESLNQTLNGQKTIVEQTAKDKNSLLVQTKNKESSYQQMVAERKKRKSDLEAEMLDVESKLKTIVDASKIPKYGKGVLKFPVENVIITQYFGNTPFSSKNPQVYNGSGHNGIDLGVRVGTPILAAQSGTVLGTGDTDASCAGASYGKWVLIRHGNGLTTLYAHLSVIQTKAGDQVVAGQKIGLSGNTGYSTGPHLHFTVYASDSVQITNYRSKACGTMMTMPIAPRAGYLNPLSYL